MLASVALVGCTNEDLPEVDNNAEGKAYVSVKLVSSSLNGSRSTTSTGYEDANPAATENKIDGSKSIFLFYEETGRWVTSGVISTETPAGSNASDGDDKTNDVEGEKTIVLQGTEQNLSNIKKVLTVINYSGCENLKQLTLEQALAKIAETTSDDAAGTKNGFLMTTSVYKSGTNTINYTEIKPGNIGATVTAAQANPVIIHVERAAAKVDVAVTATGDGLILGKPNTANADKGIVVDGVITPVQITIDGWTLNGINKDTYLVKQLEDAWKVSGDANADVPFADWNNATDFRSFWAKSTNYVNDNSLTYKTYTEAKESKTTVEYCYENNYDNYVIDYNTVTKNHKVTTVLVAAHFNLLDGTNGAATAAQTLYEFNGVFYKEANYKNLLLKQLKDAGYKKTIENVISDLEATDLTIASDGSLAKILVTVAEGTYTKSGAASSKTDIDNALKALDYVSEAQGYLNGQCYYQVPIEHLAATSTTKTYVETDGEKKYKFVEGYYGVVRNHHYKLNISAIKNIGEPVYKPEKEITDIPAKLVDYYMAAEIHVLNWKVVNQNVEL